MKKKKRKVSDIQSVIMLVLSLMTVTTSIFIGLLLYNRYETAMRHNDVSNTQNMMESMVSSTEQYLKSMRQLANTINYNIIQVYDVSDPEFYQQLSLIYEADKDKIQSIALYDMEGGLIAAEPVTLQKEGIKVAGQPWFEHAAEKVANMHFSMPHIQNPVFLRPFPEVGLAAGSGFRCGSRFVRFSLTLTFFFFFPSCCFIPSSSCLKI